jgi:hypothetical protein
MRTPDGVKLEPLHRPTYWDGFAAVRAPYARRVLVRLARTRWAHVPSNDDREETR